MVTTLARATTGGDSNNAFGMEALLTANAAANSNNAFGKDALRSVTSGDNNTGLGHGAGEGITTGSNNVCLGFNAQASAVDVSNEITFGDGNISALRSQDQSIAALSDGRDKTDVVDLPHGLDFINQTRPVRFKWDKREYLSGRYKQGTTNLWFYCTRTISNW